MLRRRFKQTLSLQERLANEAKRLREEAKTHPPGQAREDLLSKAEQYETGCQMSEWLRSPGLQPPKAGTRLVLELIRSRSKSSAANR